MLLCYVVYKIYYIHARAHTRTHDTRFFLHNITQRTTFLYFQALMPVMLCCDVVMIFRFSIFFLDNAIFFVYTHFIPTPSRGYLWRIKKMYNVYLWPFVGYNLIKINVDADSIEEALEKAVAKAESECRACLVDPSEVTEEEEVAESLLYVDATMQGGGCWYIDSSNLRIEEA